ncbi:hypothetical protein [Pedobacter gandavensis]|uniref:Uncharacterized protein n=1 Tax=Pedobacter gandavensis TaxID=2679963 RepID=A0ABR6F204_9SPHI|nr:hypothetical protein [Pedobacter gandavensis]MBB2151565.1 hypothetical protein [Pedobacter gandavensis]
MKKSGIIPFARVVLALLWLLNLGVLLISILMAKPLWIGGSISFFTMITAFQEYKYSGKSKRYLVLGKEDNHTY